MFNLKSKPNKRQQHRVITNSVAAMISVSEHNSWPATIEDVSFSGILLYTTPEFVVEN